MTRTTGQRRSKAQELRAAARFGGTVNPGSGNGWVHKADVRTGQLLIECKTTAFDSYRLDLKDLNLLEHQALLASREPVFIVEISGQEYAVLPVGFFAELMGETT